MRTKNREPIISGCITVYVPSKYYLFWHFSIAFRQHRRMDIKRSFCLLLSKPVQVYSPSTVNPSTFSFHPLSSSFIYHLSLFPGACLHLGPLFFTPPSLNFRENSCKINMLSFLKANLILSLHLSHLPPPLHHIFTFTLSSPHPVSVSHLVSVSHVFQIPSLCHAIHVTPTPCVTAFHRLELLVILVLSGCRLAQISTGGDEHREKGCYVGDNT